jgi:hypothetical protein
MPLSNFAFMTGEMRPGILTIILILTVWSLTWKGLALWKSAHNESRVWFIILLVINTFGILEIIYYFCLDKGSDEVCICDTKCVCASETEDKK